MDLMNESDMGGGFLNESTSFSEDKKKSQIVQNIVPAMIMHIINSTGELKLWGNRVHVVTFVGILRKVEEATTKILYEIEDDTGKITGHRWLEANNTAPQETWKLNTYYRVFGLPRDINGTRQIMILRIMPVEDLNELTNHLLEVTYVALKRKKAVEASSQNSDFSDGRTLFTECPGMTPEQVIVFKLIQAGNDTDCGVERSEIKKRVPKHILPQVDDIIEFLTSEGHIYSTYTDDQFKTT